MKRDLPHDKVAWSKQVAIAKLVGSSLFNKTPRASASKIKRPQFLMLRVLYEGTRSAQKLTRLFQSGDLVEKSVWDSVTNHLTASEHFQKYMQSMLDANESNTEGMFSPAKLIRAAAVS